jgi:hypothetical protein
VSRDLDGGGVEVTGDEAGELHDREAGEMLQLARGGCESASPRDSENLVLFEGLAQVGSGRGTDLVAHAVVVSMGPNHVTVIEAERLLEASSQSKVGQALVVNLDADDPLVTCPFEQPGDLESGDPEHLCYFDPRLVLKVVGSCHRGQ